MKVSNGKHNCPVCGKEFVVKDFHGDKTIVSDCDGSTTEVREGKKCFIFCQDGVILTKKDV